MGTCSSSPHCYAPQIELGLNGVAYNKDVIDRCPVLKQKYCPPRLWGHCGHLQCILFCTVTRQHSMSHVESTPITVRAEDGATISFDLFRHNDIDYEDDWPWILLAPGICNHSQSDYILAFVGYALFHHRRWRIATLNHLGTDTRIPLTAPRVFSTGCTEPFDTMVQYVRRRWSGAALVAVGFSMGANIVLKYLGEEPSRQKWFKAAVSACQAYDYSRACEWASSSRAAAFYSYVLTKRVLRLIRRHRQIIFNYWERQESHSRRRAEEKVDGGEDEEEEGAGVQLLSSTSCLEVHCCNAEGSPCRARCATHGVFPTEDVFHLDAEGVVCPRLIFKSKDFGELDASFNGPVNKFSRNSRYHTAMSSAFYMHNITDVPVLMLNADDDPIAPVEHFTFPRKLLELNPQSMFVHTHHGSHMAFFNGGVIFPTKRNVFDQIVAQYAAAVLSKDDPNNAFQFAPA